MFVVLVIYLLAVLGWNIVRGNVLCLSFCLPPILRSCKCFKKMVFYQIGAAKCAHTVGKASFLAKQEMICRSTDHSQQMWKVRGASLLASFVPGPLQQHSPVSAVASCSSPSSSHWCQDCSCSPSLSRQPQDVWILGQTLGCAAEDLRGAKGEGDHLRQLPLLEWCWSKRIKFWSQHSAKQGQEMCSVGTVAWHCAEREAQDIVVEQVWVHRHCEKSSWARCYPQSRLETLSSQTPAGSQDCLAQRQCKKL